MSMRALSRVTGLPEDVSGYLDRQHLLLRGDGAALPAGADRLRYANCPPDDLGNCHLPDLTLLHRGLHRIALSHAQRGGTAERARCEVVAGRACSERWRRSPVRTESFWSFPSRCFGSNRTASISGRRFPRGLRWRCRCSARSSLAAICNGSAGELAQLHRSAGHVESHLGHALANVRLRASMAA